MMTGCGLPFCQGALTLSALGISVAIAWHSHAVWHAVSVSTIPEDADGYVQGLAKLGIANLPAHQPQPAGERMYPMLAGK